MSDEKLRLPCLKGRIGDWFYYVSLLNFKEISNRTSLVNEIHKNKELSRWIQREVSNRIDDIVSYLNEQPQRFFNAIICGIYGGKPQWQELSIDDIELKLDEKEKDYLERTFGILTLSGDEKIFAIDGQHRVAAIKKCLKQNTNLEKEEVSVIFVAHKTDTVGEERTRRLFSTLNRYAVPVNISEIIALDEEDNCAILTRLIIENFELFKEKIHYSKSRSISPQDKKYFTNIILLYDLISIILTDKSFSQRIKITGYELKRFTSSRESEDIIKKELLNIQKFFTEVVNEIPSVKRFFDTGQINRNDKKTNLIFRPIGQLIVFYVLKIATQNKIKKQAYNYFALDSFNLSNKNWSKIFIDEESGNIKTDKSRQFLAIYLILKRIGINLKLTLKEEEFANNFNINIQSI